MATNAGDPRKQRRPIQTHEELEVYQLGFATAMRIFRYSRSFPSDEKFSLKDQIRRASRAVCANISEAWRKRRYEGSFINKLNDAEAEAAETQVWIRFAAACRYLGHDEETDLFKTYDHILGKLVRMIANPAPWLIKPGNRPPRTEDPPPE